MKYSNLCGQKNSNIKQLIQLDCLDSKTSSFLDTQIRGQLLSRRNPLPALQELVMRPPLASLVQQSLRIQVKRVNRKKQAEHERTPGCSLTRLSSFSSTCSISRCGVSGFDHRSYLSWFGPGIHDMPAFKPNKKSHQRRQLQANMQKRAKKERRKQRFDLHLVRMPGSIRLARYRLINNCCGREP